MTIHCTLCGSPKEKIVRAKVRYGIKRKVFECLACGMVYLEPKKGARQFYTGKQYRAKYGPVLGKASVAREVFEMYKEYQGPIVDELRGVLRKDMKVLDVGCSAGQFLNALKGQVKTRVGLELSENEVTFIRKHLDFPVYNEPIQTAKITEGPFDLVTALQVLEHVEEPVNFLKHLGMQLKKGGYLYLELPNLNDALVSAYNVPEYADFYYREPHLSYFSKKTLALALKKAGFRGRIKTVQRYSLMNHLHWILTGKPQPDFRAGNELPKLAKGPGVAKINALITRTDAEYRKVIAELGLGESLTFLGKKIR